ncbi:TCP-1/cpn60 chaperonin family protein [Haladaptatus sp. DFWS20]|uniref:TCP-1/cpn60 chaperonin family protein n=1 Tax=Haladaptatus sp. DFWS20 TaxID=3403467 RepID=UPI003EB6D587
MSGSRTSSTEILDGTDVLHGAALLGDLVAGLYGPDGRYKLVQTADGPVVAGDVNRLFDELIVEHPGARLVAEGAVQQKETVGDGSLSVVLLTADLARRAIGLLDRGFHRVTVIDGVNRARLTALGALPAFATPVDGLDDPRGRIAVQTALGGAPRTEAATGAVVEAARLVDRARRTHTGGLRVDDIEFRRGPTSDAADVELLRGVVLEREPVTPNIQHEIESPRIVVVGGGKKAGSGIEERELRRAGGSTGKGRTDVVLGGKTPSNIEAVRQHEHADVRRQVQTLEDAGVNAVFTTMGISDVAISALDEAGIVAFRTLTSEHARRLSRATGADVVMDLADLSAENVGTAGQLQVTTHDDDPFVRVEGCDHGQVGTLLYAGAVEQGAATFERDLMTAIVVALDVLNGGRVVPGGGGIETRLATDVREDSRSVGDRTALVMEAYADALETIPRVLARNGGADAIDVVTWLRASGENAGFDTDAGVVGSTHAKGPLGLEPIVRTTVDTATDVLVHLVRVDDVIPATADDDEITDFELRPDPERDVV